MHRFLGKVSGRWSSDKTNPRAGKKSGNGSTECSDGTDEPLQLERKDELLSLG